MYYLGYMAMFFTSYNILNGILARISANDKLAISCGLEASVWFVAGVICLK